jgi:hypothetical protein
MVLAWEQSVMCVVVRTGHLSELRNGPQQLSWVSLHGWLPVTNQPCLQQPAAIMGHDGSAAAVTGALLRQLAAAVQAQTQAASVHGAGGLGQCSALPLERTRA